VVAVFVRSPDAKIGKQQQIDRVRVVVFFLNKSLKQILSNARAE
jgi:hypothetical protein